MLGLTPPAMKVNCACTHVGPGCGAAFVSPAVPAHGSRGLLCPCRHPAAAAERRSRPRLRRPTAPSLVSSPAPAPPPAVEGGCARVDARPRPRRPRARAPSHRGQLRPRRHLSWRLEGRERVAWSERREGRRGDWRGGRGRRGGGGRGGAFGGGRVGTYGGNRRRELIFRCVSTGGW